jgi:nucleoid-associated protein YgaU
VNPTAQALLQLAGLKPSLFAANSRYQAIDTASYTTVDGRAVTYLRRRFLPKPEDLVQVAQYTVTQGDRLDTISARYLGDPTLFWRICDANGAMRPEDLLATVGTVLRICLPEGIQGAQNAS